jgi:DNA-directed RNA polymerase specialized sigma24 family protein
MLKPHSFINHRDTAHEDLFVARYERLLTWATSLTEGNAMEAEDLVHDAFIQFTLSRPDLDSIENLDGYLRQTLRNLRVSQGRRATQKRQQPLCAADYDSAELSLRAEEIHAGLGAREELQLICEYAIARRQSSKAASVLMLRFFHCYLPAEIARVMLLDEAAGRGAVKQWLSLARREARQHLHRPQSLKFIGQSPDGDPPAVRIPRGAANLDFIRSLREAIFAAPQPQGCLRARQLKTVYCGGRAEPIDTSLLAHLVCCARCLEQVNKLLRMAPLAGRFPDDPGDAASNGKRGGGNRGGSQRGNGLRLARSLSMDDLREEGRRRRDETREHHPAELHVCANGFPIAMQTVDAERSRLSLKIHLDEPLAFIEVFSEQGVRLLYLPVGEQAGGALKQAAHLELSEGRALDATLNFATEWPTLELNYRSDCGLRIADCGLRIADRGFEEADSPHSLSSAPQEPPSAPQSRLVKLKSAIRSPQSALQWLLRPAPITFLLAVPLIAAIVGQRLWVDREAPRVRETAPGKATATIQPSFDPSVEPSPDATIKEPAPGATPVINPAIATAELEIEALRLLNQAGADLHEQIEVSRTAQGRLRIAGILDTNARKAELLGALAGLKANPGVEIDLQTVAEAAERQRSQASHRSSPPVAVFERDEIAVTRLPVDSELRRHLTARGVPDDRIDEEIRRFASAMLAHARQAARHAGALRQLSARFSNGESLDPAARTKWRQLLGSHARALSAEILALRGSLAPVFAAIASGDEVSEPDALESDEDLRRAAERIASLCAESDRALIAAFSLSSDSSPAATVRTSGFWLNLRRGERLAAAISRRLSADQ